MAISGKQSWIDNSDVRREELHALCDCVSRAAASVLQFLKIGEPAIEIAGCWLNLYAPGAVHRAHSHPNNFLSAVYYVRTHPGGDSINFHDPRSQADVFCVYCCIEQAVVGQ